ncbi:MAG: putative HTH-type transcriptional regulator [Firmicutes bacterium ADurb.Bin419]|nr:MAG: putative HTH-type transcriptional regulator [Firmicutes bacterium ADurb.Bin419]
MQEYSSFNNTQQDFTIHDPLTGAYSRALLNEQFPDEVERCSRYGIPLSLCLIDIDYFKSINDAYGHIRGDQVLQSFVKRLNSLMRKSDILFRYGGDEFVLLMMNTHKKQALSLTNRMLDKIRMVSFPGDPPLNISLSIGVAGYPDDASDAEEMFNVADRRCYEAKRRGRGQVVGETYIFQNDIVFNKLSRLIERDEDFSKLNCFLELLSAKGRGILSVIGPQGSGRTSFLTKVESTVRMNNYEVLFLNARYELKSKAYGLLLEAENEYFDFNKFSTEEFDDLLLKLLQKNNRAGFVIVLDNMAFVDHATLNLLRNYLMGNKLPCFGLIYSSEPDTTRNFDYLNVPLSDTVYLKPFSPKGVNIFVRSVLSWDPEPSFLDWLYTQTMGYPKQLSESLSYLIEKGVIKKNSEHEWLIEPNYVTISLHKQFGRFGKMPQNNLPSFLTEFIGRETEMSQVSLLLDRSRLVTLVGPGGIGKTRLALQVASMRLNDFEDGVFFVSLASVTKPDLVVSSIAKVMDIVETSGQSILDSMKSALKDKHRLIIVDNFEQVISAAPMFAELLASARLITMLVTSREALHISGEHVFNVPPLDVPELEQRVCVESMMQQAAIALFVSRAQAVQNNFVLTKDNIQQVAELCDRLDGIPLAIELAASNVGRISLAEMLEQSRNRLKWLNNGPRDMPSRHQTLRSTIEWGYSLLNKDEQQLFTGLGIFLGSFTKDAVEKIMADVIGLEVSISDCLISLLDKSLIRNITCNSNDEICFEMLETIHEFAVECLNESGYLSVLEEKHAYYYLSLVEDALKNINGPEQYMYLNRLERSYSNVLAVIEWAKKKNNVALEVKLAVGLGEYWELRGRWSEGRLILDNIVNRYAGSLKSKEFAMIYHWLGRLVQLEGDCNKAIELLNTGLDLARLNQDCVGEAAILHKLGWVYYMYGDHKKTEELWNKSLELFRQEDDKPGVVLVLQDLCYKKYYEGDFNLVEKYSNESLKICKQLGNKRGIATSLNRLGRLARGKGNFEHAEKLFKEHLVACEEIKDKIGKVGTLICLAELARSERKLGLATEYYKECLKLSQEIGYKSIVASVMKDLGEIARYQGEFRLASELYNEGLSISLEVNDNSETMWIYRNMAELEMYQGNHDKARDLYKKGLEIFREHNQSNAVFVLLTLEGVAGLAALDGELVKAAKLFGITDKLFESNGKLISKDDADDYKRRFVEVQAKLDIEAFNSAWNEGRSMTVETALDFAIQDLSDNS